MISKKLKSLWGVPGNKMTRLCAYKQRCSFIEFHYARKGKKFNC